MLDERYTSHILRPSWSLKVIVQERQSPHQGGPDELGFSIIPVVLLLQRHCLYYNQAINGLLQASLVRMHQISYLDCGRQEFAVAHVTLS